MKLKIEVVRMYLCKEFGSRARGGRKWTKQDAERVVDALEVFRRKHPSTWVLEMRCTDPRFIEVPFNDDPATVTKDFVDDAEYLFDSRFRVEVRVLTDGPGYQILAEEFTGVAPGDALKRAVRRRLEEIGCTIPLE